jgi:hypothetical protein
MRTAKPVRPTDDLTGFALQFPITELEGLAGRFSYPKDDGPCLEAGVAARQRGHYTRDEFLSICCWKTQRSKSKVAANGEPEIVAATSRCFRSTDEKERMESLTSLAGVAIPTASALLFFAFPDDYPILDVRALESLGQPTNRTTYPVTYWLDYLAACRSLAGDAGVSIRTLDKALWQASKEGTHYVSPG